MWQKRSAGDLGAVAGVDGGPGDADPDDADVFLREEFWRRSFELRWVRGPAHPAFSVVSLASGRKDRLDSSMFPLRHGRRPNFDSLRHAC